MENKRFLIVIAIFIGVIFLVPILALFQKDDVSAVERAINGNQTQLVYVGSSTCPWCEQFEPILAKIARDEGFSYLEIDLEKLSSAENTKLRDLLGKRDSSFGVPHTVLVGNGQVLAELQGFNEEVDLYNFLVENNFIDGSLREETREENEDLDGGEINNALIEEINTLLNDDNRDLLVLGSSTCPWCEQFVPVLEAVAAETTLNYLYVELDKESQATYFKILDILNIADFGVPYSLVVVDGQIISELSGYRDEEGLLEYLRAEEVIE